MDNYFYPPVYADYKVAPTHHWLSETDVVASGHCFKQLKEAQAKHLKAVGAEKAKVQVLKFSKGFGDCYVTQEVALAAAQKGIHIVAPKTVIKLLKALNFPVMNPFLHEEQEWLASHPLPLELGKHELMRGIGLAVSLT